MNKLLFVSTVIDVSECQLLVGSYSRASLVLHPSEQIDLRLYHNEELEARSLEKLGQKAIGRRSSDHTEEHTEHYKKYRVFRFFKTLEGYYLGNLDLSGRHADRFKSLQRRWNIYLVEFLQLTLCTQDIVHGGVLYADYEFSDPSIWDDFTDEWNIPPSIGYGQLYDFTHGVLRTISSNPTPRIQTLCLHHLPTELLDNIFGHMCIDTARTLALTSRRFKEVGSRYIYADRKLTLRCSFNWKSFGESRNPSTYLDKIGRSDRKDFSSTAAMILSRPDHVNKMQTTSLSDHWRSHNFDRTALEGFTLSHIEPNFYNPIYQTCAKVLAAGRNLVSVSLDSLFLTFDIVQSLSNLHHLHTLTLRGCLVSAYIQQKLVPPNNGLLLSVYNLNLYLERSSTPWYMLCVCPQLRTLMVAGSARMDLSCPPLEIWHHCAFFPTLERLALNNMNSDHLSLFVDWLRSTVLTSTIPLTHLKLHSRRGMPDGSMINLLEALEHTPLKVLVLEGLARANFPLFHGIGEFFGETLIALSLTRRASNRQLKNEPVIWPHASWEYAPYFRALTQLEHFEWNVKWLDTPLALSVLERFEHGFSDGDESTKVGFYEQNNYPDHAERCELAGQMALPFAAHCSTLQTYATAGGHTHDVCKILRAPNGAILVQTPAVESRNFNPMDILRWNPSNSLSGVWPPILPGDTKISA